jgi:hypothetical protein
MNGQDSRPHSLPADTPQVMPELSVFVSSVRVMGDVCVQLIGFLGGSSDVR